MSDQETIVGVASKAYGKLYQLPKPYRHHNLLDLMYREYPEQMQVADEEGFITSTGRYVNREEAYLIAQQANQILSERHPSGLVELYSESVW